MKQTPDKLIPMEERNWMTPAEAAEKWGISVTTVYNYIATGKITSRRIYHEEDRSKTLIAIPKTEMKPFTTWGTRSIRIKREEKLKKVKELRF